MTIVFASGNTHKLKEIQSVIGDKIELISMRSLGFEGEIDEYGNTLEENAAIKARFIHQSFQVNCLADDSGLEIIALGGDPGVISARFAGLGCTHDDNIDKVLTLMNGITNRKAAFRTVFHLIIDGIEYQLEGRIDGAITTSRHGKNGFGYDPIFKPDGSLITFAEMTLAQKGTLSHRALATQKLSELLKLT